MHLGKKELALTLDISKKNTDSIDKKNYSLIYALISRENLYNIRKKLRKLKQS